MNGKIVVSILIIILLGTWLVFIGCGALDDNTPPEIDPINDKTLEIGDTRTVNVYITDVDVDDIHTISASSDNPSVATVSVDEDSLTITGNAVGMTTIKVTATDDSGQDSATSISVAFRVTVKEPSPRVEIGFGVNQPPSSFTDKGVCTVGMILKPGEGCSYDSNELFAKINFFVRQDGTVCREQVPDLGGFGEEIPIPEDLLPRKLKFCVEWDIERDDFFETRFAASKNRDGSWTVKNVP